MLEQLWEHIKIEQIAFKAANNEESEKIKAAIGGKWETDLVTGRVKTLYGRPCNKLNLAQLEFNYDLIPGKELEIIIYKTGPNWLSGRLAPSLSHLGAHTEHFGPVKTLMEEVGVRIIQEVITIHHTNPAIPKNRFYHYLIFDSNHLLGFDLKLIKRIDVR